MTLVVKATHRFGSFALEASFAADGGVTALFGRSGSGKTSLVRIIAGLVRAERSLVRLDGQVLADSDAGIFVPPHRRAFGYVFQEPRLFPHLSVRTNLSFGTWFGQGRTGKSDRDRVVSLLGLEALLHRMPGSLSGGEKQRVAIGRALLSSPRLLLMDEPLSALDEARKSEILPYLERLRDEMRIPIIYVSHSVKEVARLADRIVLLRDGRVQAAGTPAEIFSQDALLDDRRQAGTALAGRVTAIDDEHQLASIALQSDMVMVPARGLSLNQPVRLFVPARDVMLATQPPQGLSALNILEGKVVSVTLSGEGTADVRVDCGGDVLQSRITSFSARQLALAEGKLVFAIVKTVAIDPA